MLSFTLRRVLSRPGNFSIAQMFPTRAISSSRSLAMTFQRNLATTVTDRNSDSTADSEPEPGIESKPKSTGKEGKKEKKSKVIVRVRAEDKPPKSPGHAYALWLSDWIRTQPKINNLDAAMDIVTKGAQVWHTVSEHDKQPYREKHEVLRAEHTKRLEEWREKVDPARLQELNRRRVAKGQRRIRGPATDRPLTGYLRFVQHLREEYPRTEEDYDTYFKAQMGRASSQWKAMSDAEKAKYVDPAKADLAAWREKNEAESQAKA